MVPPGFSRESEIQRLTESIQRVLDRRGVCGCLASVRWAGHKVRFWRKLSLMMKAGKIPRIAANLHRRVVGKVFTGTYDEKAYITNRHLADLTLSEELQLIVLEKEQLMKIKLGGGRIFVLTAGMLTECTPAHDLALRMMGDERQAIFFVGYADPSTLQWRTAGSDQGGEVTWIFSAGAGEVTRHCEVQEFDLTAHANREALLDFACELSPRAVLLGHGEADSRQWFEDQIRAREPKIKIVQPMPGIAVDGL